jgi:hypothetical protein
MKKLTPLLLLLLLSCGKVNRDDHSIKDDHSITNTEYHYPDLSEATLALDSCNSFYASEYCYCLDKTASRNCINAPNFSKCIEPYLSLAWTHYCPINRINGSF